MRIRGLLTVGAAMATVAGAALAVQGPATAASSAARSPSAAVSSTGNASAQPMPASACESGHVTASAPGGITPTVNRRLAAPRPARIRAAGTAGATCAEPNCNVTYHGGQVQHAPRVYLVFWGPKWTSSDSSAETYLKSFYQGLGVSPETWSATSSQYHDGSGKPTFGSSALAGVYNDTNTPEKSVSLNNIVTEVETSLSHFSISNTNNAQIVVMTQSGTCYPDESGVGLFAGSCGMAQTTSVNGLYCGYHSNLVNASNPANILPFAVLPYQPDAGANCGVDFVNATGTFDGFSMVGGHEFAETASDPNLSDTSTLGWIDLNDPSGGEIGDKCAWGGPSMTDPFGDVTLSTGSFAMQSLWSNATGSCVMSGVLPVSITAPAAQSSVLGSAVSLQVSASVGGTTPLSYSASGLPPGLSINSTTGKI